MKRTGLRTNLLIRVLGFCAIGILTGTSSALAVDTGNGGFAGPGDQVAKRLATGPVEIPKAIFAQGEKPAIFQYESSDLAKVGATAVEVFRVSDGAVIRTWSIDAAAPAGQVEWDGTVEGRPVPTGKYAFRFAGQASAASAKDAVEKPFKVYDHIFPIRGKHDLGQSRTNNFGGGRGHQGQDMMAACGTPLVASHAGEVIYAGYQGAAGNYAVIQGPDGESSAYLHMRSKAVVAKGEQVLTGQQIGEVGTTGRSTACHLHFELWTAPGWQQGGRAYNPLAKLRKWDSWS